MTEIEKLYSEAFEDGINYAIEKMFAEDYDTGMDYDGEEHYKSKTKPEDTSNAKKDNIFKRAWNKVRDDWWEKGKDLREETTNDAGEKVKKLNWKRLGKRAGIIAVPTAAVAVPTTLAIRHHRKKKAAEAEAEKNYSEGFDDGVEYAQRTYGIVDTLGRKFRKLTGRETVKDKVLDLKDKAVDKWSKLNKLQKAGVIAIPVAATGTGIAISKSGKKKD